MPEWMAETERQAHDYLRAFGFSDEQIAPLVNQTRKDLENEYEKFLRLTQRHPCPVPELNDVLHALKGLLFHMGNHAMAERLNELRGDDIDRRCEEIRRLLS